jgi:hypothetical protein
MTGMTDTPFPSFQENFVERLGNGYRLPIRPHERGGLVEKEEAIKLLNLFRLRTPGLVNWWASHASVPPPPIAQGTNESIEINEIIESPDLSIGLRAASRQGEEIKGVLACMLLI